MRLTGTQTTGILIAVLKTIGDTDGLTLVPEVLIACLTGLTGPVVPYSVTVLDLDLRTLIVDVVVSFLALSADVETFVFLATVDQIVSRNLHTVVVGLVMV